MPRAGARAHNAAMASPSPNRPAIRVLIVEDEPELLHHFTQAVLADATLSLVAAVASGAAALAVLGTGAPDVVLLDLGLPDINGIEVIRHVARDCPQCDVLVVTMFGDDQHVFEALESGATGYLLKDLGLERIAASIHEVRAGGSPISPSIARRVLARMRATQAARARRHARRARAGRGGADAARDRTAQAHRQGPELRQRRRTDGHLAPHGGRTRQEDLPQARRASRGEAVYEASQLGLL